MIRNLEKIFLTLIVFQSAFGANVLWDCFSESGYDGWLEVSWRPESYNPWPYLSINYVKTSDGVNLSAGALIMESIVAWYLADYGDIVDTSTALNRNSYFAKTWDFQSSVQDATYYDIFIPNGKVAYLAVATEVSGWDGVDYHTGNYYYGWVALENDDGTLRRISSALDIDGGSMYVGGGSAPTSPAPEPSSAMLLLLGMSVLCLSSRHCR